MGAILILESYYHRTLRGVFIRRNGTMEWNGGMERWNGMEWNGMTTPTERALTTHTHCVYYLQPRNISQQ